MCDGLRCPLCGGSTVYTVGWIDLPANASGGGGGRFPSTLACRNGCDRDRMDEWTDVAPALQAECAAVGGHA